MTIGGIVLGIIVVLLGFYFISKIEPYTPVKYSAMDAPSIPTITCNYNDKYINRMYGYKTKMDNHYMRDTIFVLQDKYDMDIRITGDRNQISALTYKIYDFENDNLIQDSDATRTIKDSGSYVDATLHIESLIDEGKEYDLEIIITTPLKEDIHYYTRIIQTGAPFLDKHIELVETLHQSTFDFNATDEAFSPYKSDSDYMYDDSLSFKKVTLQATIAHLSWGDMQVKETIAPMINIVDIDGDLGFFKVDCQVGRNLTENDPQYYNVSEYFRTRINATDTFLLDYERTTDQIYVPTSDLVSPDHINLGITTDEPVESLCSPNGNHVAFVAGRSLWMMSAETKEITSIFNFASDPSDIRNTLNRHDINIVNVTDDGDVRFIVYGYMNRGIHEGKAGIGLYTFRFKDLEVVEDAFIPADVPYQVLKYSINQLCYMNSSGDLYIMIDDVLYSVDENTNSASPVVTNLEEGTYKVSEDNRILSWQAENKVNDAQTITTLDMETLKTYDVTAEDGKCIKVLGFLNDDLIYGQGNAGEIYKDANDVEYLLMSHMYAVDPSGRRQHENTENGYYFISAEQEYNRLIADRVYKGQEEYIPTESFTIFATDMPDYPEATSYTATEETRKQVLLLKFPVENTASAPLNIILSTKVRFSSEEVSDVSKMINEDWNYLVYAKGQLLSLEKAPAKAVMDAYENTGCVVNKDGTYFYRRGMRATTSEIEEKDIALAAEAYKNETAINITGIELPQAMSFLARKIPLIWEDGDNAYVLTGYTASDALILYDIETGEISYLSSGEADRRFTTAGRCFIYEK